ncbi:phosphoribosyl pyrophosphate synthase-associated protein 1-like isoform X1 [Pollicipes pollicipes]|uniref:phosphoribosyl pyrophosphate synthase-associated protein 1-like isoform X3 n=1 Tax=Pollicipes pollicipes TaxID=41117 RepID=UPI001885A040|nr:phosphoribosyl pyrophosphate synthase-associated protein 1-like isoform X3 [Pollicipes pollicipes]XP_037094080.1 phosphoribosyl pyrophosphate synthase-associated protein 1-like isoform X1 [Pollicipes pollicipes]XP_037094081.1 phosphoribosyl pyrophosphate synthase-associated protein 1-like isoform X1 [Pollicipes pollicipes]XP_037094082.1 phosphoribosyl pyrophosphate synthase-associated protein 1-like isoform X1 [Pollicipes pollicipes]XP_037094083.1 phosphoribosyl pyrophosphate synthase-associ
MNTGVCSGDIMILAGNSHPTLAQLIAEKLDRKLVEAQIGKFANRETQLEIMHSLRDRDVYILQTGGNMDVNNSIMELLVMAYACKTSSARNIIGVIPYLPYSKQSKMRKRGCIVSKLLAKMMCKAGLTHIITMDLHQKEIQGFFDCPVDNLRASPFLLNYIREQIPDYRNAVIVAKDPASCKRATSYAERLRLGIAVIHGEAKTPDDEDDVDADDGRTSPPPEPPARHQGRLHSSVSMSGEVDPSRIMTAGVTGVPMQAAKEKPPISVVGDVGGRIAIMVDDMIDDVRSFVAAAEMLKERGAYKIYVLATHGLLSADAPRLIEESAIDEVVVTNTVPHDVQKIHCHKIKTVDVSILLAEAIRRLHNKESLSYLFRNITTED